MLFAGLWLNMSVARSGSISMLGERHARRTARGDGGCSKHAQLPALAAIRALLKGHARSLVCDLYDCTERCVRLWIERLNQGGISSLISRPRLGRLRKVKLERVRDLLLPVLEDPTMGGEVHWTEVKIHGYLQEQWLHIVVSSLR